MCGSRAGVGEASCAARDFPWSDIAHRICRQRSVFTRHKRNLPASHFAFSSRVSSAITLTSIAWRVSRAAAIVHEILCSTGCSRIKTFERVLMVFKYLENTRRSDANYCLLRSSHWVGPIENGIRVTDVRESKEAFERFAADKLGPAEVGLFTPLGSPSVWFTTIRLRGPTGGRVRARSRGPTRRCRSSPHQRALCPFALTDARSAPYGECVPVRCFPPARAIERRRGLR